MFAITLQRDILKAVSRFAGKNDIRYYLNGIKVEVYPNVAYVIGCDGHRLAVARVSRPDNETWEHGEAIIPADSLAAVLKSGSPAVKRLAVVLSVDGDSFTFNACGATSGGKVIDGKYPDWRKVIPAKLSGEVAQFNAEYLADCHKAAQDLGRKYSPAIGHNGLGSAILELREDVLAIVMPMRNPAPAESPEWARGDLENVGRELDTETAHELAIADALEMAWGEAIAEDEHFNVVQFVAEEQRKGREELAIAA